MGKGLIGDFGTISWTSVMVAGVGTDVTGDSIVANRSEAMGRLSTGMAT